MAPQSVLFICTHNAGRSQMAAGFLNHLGTGVAVADSAGTAPADALNPVVVAAMLEEGIDLRGAEPSVLTSDALNAADLVVTLGVRVPLLNYPVRRLDWDLPDPAGERLDTVRAIRDEIKALVIGLLADLDARAVA